MSTTTLKNHINQWKQGRTYGPLYEQVAWYPWELPRTKPGDSIRESYTILIDRVLDTSRYVFITVNINTRQIKRALDAKQKKAGGMLRGDYLKLGQEWMLARRSGVSAVDAMEAMWNKFLKRFESKVLGSQRVKRCGQQLSWIRIYENEGKRYNRSPPTHLHMLLKIPDHYEYREFVAVFKELFSWLVYPSPPVKRVNKVLDIRIGRHDGENSHPDYVQKQLIDWDTAADRVHVSEKRARYVSVGQSVSGINAVDMDY
jgi:hypothetical protein